MLTLNRSLSLRQAVTTGELTDPAETAVVTACGFGDTRHWLLSALSTGQDLQAITLKTGLGCHFNYSI